jgi:hypothetical protein
VCEVEVEERSRDEVSETATNRQPEWDKGSLPSLSRDLSQIGRVLTLHRLAVVVFPSNPSSTSSCIEYSFSIVAVMLFRHWSFTLKLR